MRVGIYRHYKGGMYNVLLQARHTETMEKFVVYRRVDVCNPNHSVYWVRPYDMFHSNVKNLHGEVMKRFVFVEDGQEE